MRFSDINVRYIYNVIFDPVEACEFNGKHLAVVLKKNNDKRTFIVMPLTTAPNGVGVNKIEIGQIATLPTSLRKNRTFAVFNQIRTVNANRFIALKEGKTVIKCPMDSQAFSKLLVLGIREILYNLSQDEKIAILRKAYSDECVIKAKDLAYNIKGLQKSRVDAGDEIPRLRQKIKKLLQGISYSLEKQYIEDGIQGIFDEAMQDK